MHNSNVEILTKLEKWPLSMVHHVDNVFIIIQTSKTQINAHTDVDKPNTSAMKKTGIVTIKKYY